MKPILRKGTKVFCVVGPAREAKAGRVMDYLHNPRHTLFFEADGSLLWSEQEVKIAVEQIDDCVIAK